MHCLDCAVRPASASVTGPDVIEEYIAGMTRLRVVLNEGADIGITADAGESPPRIACLLPSAARGDSVEAAAPIRKDNSSWVM